VGLQGSGRTESRLGHIDAAKIAAMDREELVAVFVAKPALHRFPANMGRRAWDLCVHLTEHYGGKGENVWNEVRRGDVLFERLRALPGFGEEKAKIFVAILAKRFGVQPAGWEEAAGPFADMSPRSVADIDSPAAFARVREWKKAAKAAKRDKQDRPLVP
jgi:uncharacterized HhH-GPD family protein